MFFAGSCHDKFYTAARKYETVLGKPSTRVNYQFSVALTAWVYLSCVIEHMHPAERWITLLSLKEQILLLLLCQKFNER